MTSVLYLGIVIPCLKQLGCDLSNKVYQTSSPPCVLERKLSIYVLFISIYWAIFVQYFTFLFCCVGWFCDPSRSYCSWRFRFLLTIS